MAEKVTNLADKQNPFLAASNETGCALPLDEKGQATLEEFNLKIAELNDPNIAYQKKLDAIIELNTRIVPIVFQQLLTPAPNIDVSMVASRACNALRDASQIIISDKLRFDPLK